VKALLADVNIQGHVDSLVVLMKAEPWKLYWDHLNLDYFHFTDIGLERESPDSLIWRTCQKRELVLVYLTRSKLKFLRGQGFSPSG
jgi:hypothetical protein